MQLKVGNFLVFVLSELRERYESKMKDLREELDMMRKSQVHEIEEVSGGHDD